MAKKHDGLAGGGGLASEFRAFLLRGNVIDLAVGVIIGGAFNKIITSLVNDVVMPLVSLVAGGGQFGAMFVALDGNAYATAEEAIAAQSAVIYYGNFISTLLDFLLMGLVVFFMVKIITLVRGKIEKREAEADAKPQTKTCPFCVSEIRAEASVCPMCTSKLVKEGTA